MDSDLLLRLGADLSGAWAALIRQILHGNPKDT